jgi:NAD-dependent dihydropyrimidine dehydrogenase PreA subunit
MTTKPWFPTIYADKCNGCHGTYKCVSFCPHDVLEVRDDKAAVTNPLGCIYGCSTCADLCPTDAILFPSKEASYKAITKKSWLHRVVCSECGKKFLTDRETDYCFRCEDTLNKKHTIK